MEQGAAPSSAPAGNWPRPIADPSRFSLPTASGRRQFARADQARTTEFMCATTWFKNKFLWRVIFCLTTLTTFAGKEFLPGQIWYDTDGRPIQAHGGGILTFDGTFYWYGEDRTPGLHAAVSCYSSTNLYDWKREGVALWRTNLPRVQSRPTFVERPKVIFNPHTKRFVMWMHLEQNGYHCARAGVAVSDTPTGPFTFLNSFRPVTNDFNFSNDANRQTQFGATFRDMNLFVEIGRASC